MIRIERTDSNDADFISLVRLLDADLAKRDGADNIFYSQFNKIDMIRNAIVAYDDDIPSACGAMKEFDSDSMEVKRMYTIPEKRGSGLAKAILSSLEIWAKELNYRSCVLETGRRQPEAIALYKSQGYEVIPNYGQYIGIENSICFKKNLG